MLAGLTSSKSGGGSSLPLIPILIKIVTEIYRQGRSEFNDDPVIDESSPRSPTHTDVWREVVKKLYDYWRRRKRDDKRRKDSSDLSSPVEDITKQIGASMGSQIRDVLMSYVPEELSRTDLFIGFQNPTNYRQDIMGPDTLQVYTRRVVNDESSDNTIYVYTAMLDLNPTGEIDQLATYAWFVDGWICLPSYYSNGARGYVALVQTRNLIYGTSTASTYWDEYYVRPQYADQIQILLMKRFWMPSPRKYDGTLEVQTLPIHMYVMDYQEWDFRDSPSNTTLPKYNKRYYLQFWLQNTAEVSPYNYTYDHLFRSRLYCATKPFDKPVGI